MPSTILVAGAWLGAACWDRVTPYLRETDLTVYTPSLSGLGDPPPENAGNIDLSTHIDDIGHLIESNALTDVTLIGHSYAGMVITGVADQWPNALSHLVYLDAFHPSPGQSVTSGYSTAGQQAVRAEAAALGDGTRWPVPPDLADLSVMTDFTPDDLSWFHARTRPHPLGCFTQPLSYTESASPPYRRTCIVCTRDRPDWRATLTPTQCGPDWHVETLDTGHWPMVTTPQSLAELIVRLSQVAQ